VSSVTRDDELTDTIRTAIADDHAVVRHGLRQVLEAAPEFDVVAEPANLGDARRYVRGHHPYVRTVEAHRAHIQQKLSRATRSDLVRYALEHKLVET
jgi:DNA-binding NarL/FixJ family response regulator